MSRYVDVYLLPVPKRNVAQYRKMARAASRVFLKHGALTYREYIESDLKVFPGLGSFPKTLKVKRGEVLIYAAVEFKSEAHRNKVMKLVFSDPKLMQTQPKKPVFDMKRMVYGGFKIFVNG